MIRDYTDKEIIFLKNKNLEYLLELDISNEDNLELYVDVLENLISMEGLNRNGEYNKVGAICKDILLNIEEVDLYEIYGDNDFLYQNIIN